MLLADLEEEERKETAVTGGLPSLGEPQWYVSSALWGFPSRVGPLNKYVFIFLYFYKTQ